MTWADGISFIEQGLTLAALVGVVYSAIEFVRGTIAQRESCRRAEVDQWRKASVQRIVTRSPDFLSVESITQALRSQSFDAPIDIEKNELTVEAVRVLLMEMVKDGIVGQVWNDMYGLVQIHRDVTLSATIANVKGSIAVRTAFAHIHENPGRYLTEELFSKVDPALDISLPDFVLAISDLEFRSVAKKDPDGKWSPVVSKSKGT